MRLIDADALIEKFVKEARKTSDVSFAQALMYVCTCLDYDAIEHPKWIPVTKRLPTAEDANPNESVIAINKDDGFGRSWIWDIVERYPQEFTHWMPIPKPPKGDE